jgi:RNA polymerase sigma-70 factor (ECF subfamily)
MTQDLSSSSGFDSELLALLPRLRGYAFALAGDRDRADDLVQGTVLNALSWRSTFKPGTNLGAWLFRILRNLHIDGFRRQRPTVPLEGDVLARLSGPPPQDDAVLACEFQKAFRQLTSQQREALVLSVIDGLNYDEIAARTGVAVGTVKSRVSRARDRLYLLMTGEMPESQAQSATERRARRRAADRDAIEAPAP